MTIVMAMAMMTTWTVLLLAPLLALPPLLLLLVVQEEVVAKAQARSYTTGNLQRAWSSTAEGMTHETCGGMGSLQLCPEQQALACRRGTLQRHHLHHPRVTHSN
mmetsp:Transcript_24878/g.44235  ORF Transcript_24878/g.44235 Transcript_24878/m.44235 type:complete len:104 (-) Transcript_24878:39-350(-)